MNVEWKRIEMPLPRLQTVGATEQALIYRIAWSRDVRLAAVTRWHRNPESTLGVARAIYLRLPADVPLWERGAEFRLSACPGYGPGGAGFFGEVNRLRVDLDHRAPFSDNQWNARQAVKEDHAPSSGHHGLIEALIVAHPGGYVSHPCLAHSVASICFRITCQSASFRTTVA